MYAFCFTIPYGFILALGGVIAFFTRGSQESLFAGVISGAIMMWMGTLSIECYKKGDSYSQHNFISMITSGTITVLMGKRYVDTGKFMPAVVVGILSLTMTLFLLYRILKPLPAKKESTD
eukprot:CAMPEP_0114506154 /NCGR_PEP_ID=MMETSP0109-20121206/11265_1 /TAXON_ID=29199 /ORGANISM="Chlorarachnion reptans, Strain CCCM449" /LENGTH=119 /DNA_ID=CAMNT_0001684701 /DNA_START=185 /DNA_END=544 /DNA_ORIENTATION=+